MKKVISIVLALVMVAALIGCGTDYKQLGYDTAKECCAELDEEFQGEDMTEDEYKLSMSFWIALIGEESLNEEIFKLAKQKNEENQINIPENKMADWNAGVQQAADEWIAKFK